MTDRLPTYIGYCCREWIMPAIAQQPGRCGYCGERPTYLRPDTYYDQQESA